MTIRRALIGFTGFVGQNLLHQIRFDAKFNSKNIEQLRGQTFDEIYCCGLPAAKWLANKNPTDDWQNVAALISVLETVTSGKFILISTIDVYSEEQLHSGSANEISQLTEEGLHPYGRHRLLFERFIQSSFENCLIVRLPALFGFGLKKNAIYDLLNNNQVGNLCPDSQFQFYHLRNLARDIQEKVEVAQASGLQTINLFSEPVSLRTIVNKFFPQFVISGDIVHLPTETPQLRQTPCRPQTYNVKTCYTQSRYWLSETQILEELQLYLTTHLCPPIANLVVSNIAWNLDENEQALHLLRSHGIQNLEIAPTKLCPWQDLESFDTDSYLSNLDRFGLKIDSAQAVTFGLPQLQLFASQSSRLELFEHLCRVIVFVAKLKANLIVFGSPRNRSILDVNAGEVQSIAVEFFSNLADFAAQHSVCFCIEPNAKQYGCDFCTGAEEAAALVRRVNKPNFRLHFDTGCSEMEKEDCAVLTRVDSVLNHVHISRPFLETFGLNEFSIHQQWSKSLASINYSGKICIELAGKSEQLNLSNVNDALLIVRAAYRNNLL